MAATLASSCILTDTDSSHLAVGECADCSIEMEEVWSTLPGDPNVSDVGTWIESDRTIWAMQGFAGHAILRFDVRSRTSALYDRAGEGPGEFTDIMGGVWDIRGDTLIIADAGRVSLLDTALAYQRSFNSPVSIRRRGLAQLPDGDFVLLSALPDSAGAVKWLHRISRTGDLVASFAPGPRSPSPSLALGEDRGQVWLLTPLDRGVSLELWNAEAGAMVRSHLFQPDWWIPERYTPMERERQAERGITRHPPPTHATTAFERNGILWLVVYQATRNWEQRDRTINDPAGSYDSVLIAIDARSGVPLASRAVVVRLIGAVTNRGHLVTFELEGDGHPRYRLHDFRLVRP